jgi:hypothetical protein
MGATEGALPLGLTDDGAPKAARHFDVVGTEGVSIAVADLDRSRIDLSAAARSRLRVQILAARNILVGEEARPAPTS